MRALIIEDDKAVSASIQKMLESGGFAVEAVDEGEEGIDRAKIYEYDVIVLDLGLPDMSGLEVLLSLRRSRIDTPVVVVSGDGDIGTKVRSLGLGADDYVTKPFARDELVARIQAVVRRSHGLAENIVEVGDLCLNMDTHRVTVGGVQVHLTAKEFQILELLALRRGSTMTKEMILNHLYGGMDEPEAKIVDVFICKLRKKLSAVSDGRSFVETVWGRGYVLRVTAPKVASAA